MSTNSGEVYYASECTIQNIGYWIGFTDEAQEGVWVWVTGEPVTYTHWYPGEPNNFPSCTGGEDYAEMDCNGWNDLGPSCWAPITKAIIEKTDTIPPVTTTSPSTTTTSTTTTIPINDGLVAYYPFNGNANDESGNGHDGTIYGNPKFVTGVQGTALRFDGVGDYVTVNDFFFNRRNNTICLWVKPTIELRQQDFISKHSQALDCEILIRTEEDGKYDVETNIGGIFYDLTVLCPWCNDTIGLQYPSYDKYDFLVQTYDGAQFKFYINGVLTKQFSVTGDLLDNNLKLTIGAWSANPSVGNLIGEIDEIRIYERTLSEPEIQELYTIQPTAIKLSSFTATPKSTKVILQWNTESETDNAGFNIYRATAEDGEYEKINDELIAAEGSSTQGASYEFINKDLKNGKTYYYKLEDVDLNGISTFHIPVKTVPRWIYGFGR